jgi:hypothetical protein
MAGPQDLIWTEPTEQLVFALDVGTTSSALSIFGDLAGFNTDAHQGAVSICHLVPGKTVDITTAHRWRGQEDIPGEPKASLVVYSV